MKILKSMILAVGFSLTAQFVYGASVNLAPENLSEAHKVSMGVEYSNVFERELDVGDDEIYKSNIALVNATYGLSENYFMYAKLGISDLKFKHIAIAGTDRAEYKVEYDHGPAWAIGAKAVYRIGESIITNFDFQYFGATGDVNDITVADTKATGLSTDSYFLTELSTSAILGYELFCWDAKFTPYVGIRASYYKLDFGTVKHDGVTVGSHIFYGFSGDEKADNIIGIITGINAKFSDSYYLTLEGRFIDEAAMTVAFVYGF